MKENITPRQYIQKTYEIIAASGVEGVSIRLLGKEMGCNTANLYRYFKGLDELIVYASLRYLVGYLNEVVEYAKRNGDPYELHVAVWDCFAKHSFQNPEIFNNLFFGKHSDSLDEIVQAYYKIFPEDLKMIEGSLVQVFTSGNFDFRDYLMISRCVEDGWFSPEDAGLLNTLSIHLYKGFLKDVLDRRMRGEATGQEKEQFMTCLTKVFHKYRLK